MIEELLRQAARVEDPTELKAVVQELHTWVVSMSPRQFQEYQRIFLGAREELKGVLAKS